MSGGARGVQRLYLVLTLLTTLAASFIWGVNTLFLLDAERKALTLCERKPAGTWQVLRGLKAIGYDVHEPWLLRARDWLESVQHADGGWGERCNTYDDPVFKGQGPSTASLASGLSPAVKPAAAAAAEPPFPLSYVLLGVAGLVILALVLRRSKANAATAAAGFSAAPGAAMQGGTATAPRGFGAQFTPNAPMNRSGYAPAAQPMGGGMGSGIGGAVIGGLAGVAAGYALSKALEGNQNSNSSNANPADNNKSYVPIDSPAQPDLGGFDAGSDGGWDDSSSSGGDDSW